MEEASLEGLEELEPPFPPDGLVTVCVSPFGFVVVWVVKPSLFVVTSVTVPSFLVVTSFVVPSFWRVTSLMEPSFAVVTSFTVPSAYCSTTVVVPSSFWTVSVDLGISVEETESVPLTGSVSEDDTTSSPPPAFRATNVTVPAIKRTAAPAVDPMAIAFFLFSRIHIFNFSIKCFTLKSSLVLCASCTQFHYTLLLLGVKFISIPRITVIVFS